MTVFESSGTHSKVILEKDSDGVLQVSATYKDNDIELTVRQKLDSTSNNSSYWLDALEKGQCEKSILSRIAPRFDWTFGTYISGRIKSLTRWLVESHEDTNYSYRLNSLSMLHIAHTIAMVTGKPVRDIQAYFAEAEQDEALSRHIAEATKRWKQNFRADTVARYGRRLGWYAMARICKPEIVVESGIEKGLGTVLLASALMRNSAEGAPGRIYGLDINPEAGFLLSGQYAEFGEVIAGDSLSTLNSFPHKIGLFIHDSNHAAEHEYNEYVSIKDKLASGAIILSDNSHATDALAKFSQQHNRRFLFQGEFPENHWYSHANCGGIGFSFAT